MENPGITIVRISKIVGVRHQTAWYHLQRLKRRGHVVAHPKGNRHLHFLNGAVASQEECDLIPVANDPVTMQILENIARNPGIMKKDVAVSVGLSRTGGAWHVNKLAKKGIVREERVRGHCYLYPVADRVEQLQALRRLGAPAPADEAPPIDPQGRGLT